MNWNGKLRRNPGKTSLKPGRPNQRSIVADDRENTNTLVLAGPGAGERVLVHRIAYLVRIRRENPRAIVVQPTTVMPRWKSATACAN